MESERVLTDSLVGVPGKMGAHSRPDYAEISRPGA